MSSVDQQRLQLAKARFRLMLQKEKDPRDLPGKIDELHAHVDNVLARNTSGNIQTCTTWISTYLFQSPPLIEALGQYLVALSKSIVLGSNRKPGLASRKRVDILLIVSGILNTDAHNIQHGQDAPVADGLKQHAEELVTLAASGIFRKGSKLESRLATIIRTWEINRSFSQDRCQTIRMKAAKILEQVQPRETKENIPKALNYTLPVGPRDIPWYELPASAMLDQLYLYPGKAVDIKKLKVKTFGSPAPSQKTQDLLDEYWETVEALDWRATADAPPGDYTYEYDSFGQTVRMDRRNGATKTMFNYYGWSIPWCEEIKKYGKPLCVLENREDAEDRLREEAEERSRREAEEDAARYEQERQRDEAREEARERERRAAAAHYDNQRPPPPPPPPVQGFPPPPLPPPGYPQGPGYMNLYPQPYQVGYGNTVQPPPYGNGPYGQANYGYNQNVPQPGRGGPNFGRGGVGQGGNGWNRSGFNANMRARGRGGPGWN
ncbi:hypothetical protein BCR34DRAFT_580453 [Clohesyomyces aquaticus]|uniref:CID domain-containing protein n=1 Tax=Clohesyomyces aquaticus TaxID=1231657 RepID=A0A1Y1Y677_9PLEO|nr:hypothetical protein BCR34DRAFT_580453 [Clohesyomyces aquaticus]